RVNRVLRSIWYFLLLRAISGQGSDKARGREKMPRQAVETPGAPEARRLTATGVPPRWAPQAVTAARGGSVRAAHRRMEGANLHERTRRRHLRYRALQWSDARTTADTSGGSAPRRSRPTAPGARSDSTRRSGARARSRQGR